MNEIKYNLCDSLAFNMARGASLATTALCRRLAPFDLTAVQWGILATLRDRPDISPSDLVEALDRDLPSTVRLVWKLEKKGLISREYPTPSRHSYRLRLTQEGHAAYERIVPMVLELNKEIYGDMDLFQLWEINKTIGGLIQRYATLLEA